MDTIRNKFLALALVSQGLHTMFVGNVGVGKTMIVQSVLDSLPSEKTYMIINFSAQTSSNSLQVRRRGSSEQHAAAHTVLLEAVRCTW